MTGSSAPRDGRLRVGVAGLGAVAQAVHLPLLARLPDAFEIAALCDLSPALRDAIGERYAVPPDRRVASVDGAARACPASTALLLLTSGSHGADALAALDRGLPVLCEKPLAFTRGRGRPARGVAERRPPPARLHEDVRSGRRRGAPGRGGRRRRAWASSARSRSTVLHPTSASQLAFAHLLPPPTDVDPAAHRGDPRRGPATLVAPAIGDRATTTSASCTRGILLSSVVHELSVIRAVAGDVTAIDHVDVVGGSPASPARSSCSGGLPARRRRLARLALPARLSRPIARTSGSTSSAAPSSWRSRRRTGSTSRRSSTISTGADETRRRVVFDSIEEAFERELLAFRELVLDGGPARDRDRRRADRHRHLPAGDRPPGRAARPRDRRRGAPRPRGRRLTGGRRAGRHPPRPAHPLGPRVVPSRSRRSGCGSSSLIDELLDAMEADPRLALHARRPDGDRRRLPRGPARAPSRGSARLIAAGRLAIGPWQILMDEFLVSGETIVRNLELGCARAPRSSAGRCRSATCPTCSATSPRCPRSCAGPGSATPSSGAASPRRSTATRSRWLAPDGSDRPRPSTSSAATATRAYLFDDPGPASPARSPATSAAEPSRSSATGRSSRCTATTTARPVADAYADARRRGQRVARPDIVVRIETLADYIRAFDAADADPDRPDPSPRPSGHGELRSGARANMLMGVTSARIDVKQAAGARRARSSSATPSRSPRSTAATGRRACSSSPGGGSSTTPPTTRSAAAPSTPSSPRSWSASPRPSRSARGIVDRRDPAARGRRAAAARRSSSTRRPSTGPTSSRSTFDVPAAWETVELELPDGQPRADPARRASGDRSCDASGCTGRQVPELFARRLHGRELFGHSLDGHLDPAGDGRPRARPPHGRPGRAGRLRRRHPPRRGRRGRGRRSATRHGTSPSCAAIDGGCSPPCRCRPSGRRRSAPSKGRRSRRPRADPVVVGDRSLANGSIAVEVADDGTLTIEGGGVRLTGVGPDRRRRRLRRHVQLRPAGRRSPRRARPAWSSSSRSSHRPDPRSPRRRGPLRLAGRTDTGRSRAAPRRPRPSRSRPRLELRAGEPFVRVSLSFTNPSRDHRVRWHLPLPAATDRTGRRGPVRRRRARPDRRGRPRRGAAADLPGPRLRPRGRRDRPARPRHRVRAGRGPGAGPHRPPLDRPDLAGTRTPSARTRRVPRSRCPAPSSSARGNSGSRSCPMPDRGRTRTPSARPTGDDSGPLVTAGTGPAESRADRGRGPPPGRRRRCPLGAAPARRGARAAARRRAARPDDRHDPPSGRHRRRPRRRPSRARRGATRGGGGRQPQRSAPGLGDPDDPPRPAAGGIVRSASRARPLIGTCNVDIGERPRLVSASMTCSRTASRAANR